jgi:hypothetical protein
VFATRDVLLYGVVAGVLAGLFAYALPWARLRGRFFVAGVATALGFIAWNLVISHARAAGLDVDAPVIALSWQDVGSGILALAACSVALAAIERTEPAGEVVLTAVIAGLTAMVFDIFVL